MRKMITTLMCLGLLATAGGVVADAVVEVAVPTVAAVTDN